MVEKRAASRVCMLAFLSKAANTCWKTRMVLIARFSTGKSSRLRRQRSCTTTMKSSLAVYYYASKKRRDPIDRVPRVGKGEAHVHTSDHRSPPMNLARVGIWEQPCSRRGGGGEERGGDPSVAPGGGTIPGRGDSARGGARRRWVGGDYD